MALTMLDKQAENAVKSPWSPEIAAEFEREKNNPNPCVGNALVSESDRVRVWTIRLKPGERIGFHRHVLDYFWTAVTGGRGRQHVHDGTTVEYTYAPGETRHETYGLHDHRIPAKRQQGAAATGKRAATGRRVSRGLRAPSLLTCGRHGCPLGLSRKCTGSVKRTSQPQNLPAHWHARKVGWPAR